jgi:hypothetical protein
VACATGASRSRISQGVAELEAGDEPLGRVRRRGGGRKALSAADPGLVAALLALVEPTRRGHPQSPLCVVSVDTKKKELVGAYKNGGTEWRPAGEPEQVKVHDFIDPALGKVNPYGVYDLGANTGWVSVGTDHDTAAFAVETIRRWWQATGSASYPHASRLLITADGGGSNGYRTRLWKTELAALAAQTGLTITVCHLPPGTSKWNKIEHGCSPTSP